MVNNNNRAKLFLWFRFLNHVGKAAEEGGANVTVFDINKSMLDVGKSRAEKLGNYSYFGCM